MGGFVAKVARRDQPVGAELLVNRKIPLLHVGRTHVERHTDVNTGLGEKAGCRAWRRHRQRKCRNGLALVRIAQSSRRTRKSGGAAERTVVGKAVEVKLLGIVVEQPVAGSDGFMAFTARIPVHAEARREILPMTVDVGACRLRVATVEESGRRIGEYLGNTDTEPERIEMASAMITISGRKVWFPAQTVV